MEQHVAAIKRRSKLDREKALEETGRLSRRGFSQNVIAEKLGVSQAQVSTDLKIVRKRYAESIHNNRAELVQEKLEQYKEILQEAWVEWERSKEDTFRKVEELCRPFKKDGDETPMELSADDVEHLIKVKEIITTEGRVAEVAFLKVIADCLKAERDLLGLDEPKKIDSNSTVNQFNWDLLQQIPTVGDTVNQRIQAILDQQSQAPKQLPNGLVESPCMPEESSGNGQVGKLHKDQE